MVIPLIRPMIPELKHLEPLLKKSRKANQWSNFGPNYYKSVDMLFNITNRFVLPVTNGTVAIQLACRTILPVGSRVVIPDFTHIGTYVGVKDAGMIPIIMQSNEDTWALDLDDLAIHHDKYDAFVVVAPFGYNVETEWYENFAEKHNKKIIYDFAGAWGQFPDTDFPVCYSLHATKSWSTGEGGLVSFNTDREMEFCRQLSNFGISPTGEIFEDGGGNYKMDEIRCAIIVAHLNKYDKIEERIRQRKNIYENYCRALYTGSVQHTPSLCVIPNMSHINPKDFANKFVCKYYFPLLSRMPHLSHVERLTVNIGEYFTRTLALPTDVTTTEQSRIIKCLEKIT